MTLWRDVREKGSVWGMVFTVGAYRFFGCWVAEPVLWGVVAYFFFMDGQTRRVSRQFLQKATGVTRGATAPGWGMVYRHYLSFARTSLDRFDMWSDRIKLYTFHGHGEDYLVKLVEAKRGAVLIGAHLGNFDAMRALAKRRGGKVHILTDRRTSQKFSAILRRYAPRMEEGVVEQAAGSIDRVLELKRAVEQGEFVGLLGDRIAADSERSAKRVSRAAFLGEEALFSQTPFIFAAHLECPVFLLFGVRRSYRVYDLFVEPFAHRIEFPDGSREEALTRYAAAYAARLEYYCRRYPLQWFNFYDFWGKPS